MLETTLLGPSSRRMPLFVGLAVILGVALRLLAASRGYNYDMESYRIVADITAAGGNVYAETHRYNYGPLWFYIVEAIDRVPWFPASEIWALRWKVAVFLTAIDLLLSLLLQQWFGWRAALLFWLNPIAIIITGYHSQFDNLAVLLGLVAAKMLDDNRDAPAVAHLPGLAVLGVSLITKHILFFLPIWLAIKQPSTARKALYLLIPFGIFIISFIPYLVDGGAQGIGRNVLLYRSFNNGPFWAGVAPQVLADKVPLMLSFLVTLTLLGFLWRKLPPLESALRYLVAVVTFSAAVANQYLAIPLAAIAAHWNVMYAVYSILGGVYLVAAKDGLHWPTGLGSSGYDELILCLFLGLVLHTVPREWINKVSAAARAGLSWIRLELAGQLVPWSTRASGDAKWESPAPRASDCLALLAVVALGATTASVFLQQENASLQREVNERQKVVEDGARLGQLNAQLVQALVNVAAQADDAAIRDLLAGQGITFTSNRPPEQRVGSGK